MLALRSPELYTWTALIERIQRSQPRGSSVTSDVVWYKKMNWATGTYCLRNENSEIPWSEAVGGES